MIGIAALLPARLRLHGGTPILHHERHHAEGGRMGGIQQGRSETFPGSRARSHGLRHLPGSGWPPAPRAKPLKGFGSGVLEVVSRHDGGTFRAVYTVRLETAVYVLHAFQKKAKRGIATPKVELDRIRQHLKAAERHDKDARERGKRP